LNENNPSLCGNIIRGKEKLQEYLKQIPASHHHVQAIDCHAISQACTGIKQDAIVVTATGYVNYGVSDTRKLFHQQWVLGTDPNKPDYWNIITDTFRLLQGDS